MARLAGKIALITGGTTGIGAATARLFQQEGAVVIATGSSAASAERARAELPGVEVVVSDQADTAASKALVDDVKARHGRIDILFVNAGVAHFAPLEAVDEAFFDREFGVNVRGAYFLLKHAAPAIPDGGAVILTASTAASSGGAGMSVYSATKAALRSFGRTLAAELAPRGVRPFLSRLLVEAEVAGALDLFGRPEAVHLVAGEPQRSVYAAALADRGLAVQDYDTPAVTLAGLTMLMKARS